mmetsp:Transcript_16964/g.43590  ORF Transcript_16964/g.43590 Transcript_16964/m.43590 type:complete len:226 (+) Transcript_16964:253-930(+)
MRPPGRAHQSLTQGGSHKQSFEHALASIRRVGLHLIAVTGAVCFRMTALAPVWISERVMPPSSEPTRMKPPSGVKHASRALLCSGLLAPRVSLRSPEKASTNATVPCVVVSSIRLPSFENLMPEKLLSPPMSGLNVVNGPLSYERMSKREIRLPLVAAANTSPCGSKATAGWFPSAAKRKVPAQSVERKSQIRAVPSLEAEVKMSSFGDISRDTISSVWARKLRR